MLSAIFNVMPVWAWIAISGLFFAGGEFLSKEFATKPGWTVFAFILIVDVISITAWLPAIFQRNQLSTTGVIWSITSLALTVLVGILFFGEKLTLINSLGLVFGVVSVTLLSL